MIQCAQCCKKHLSAALAYFAETAWGEPDGDVSGANAATYIYLGRAFINMVEATEGYTSHTDLARGFLVMAEECACRNPELQKAIRAYRLGSFEDGLSKSGFPFSVAAIYMFSAHLCEAKRELPGIRAIDPVEYSGGKSMQDTLQRNIDYLRACLKWLDENIFLKEEGKGEDKMATKAKKACGKGGCAAKAKKAAAKGGCAAKGGKKGKK